MHLQRHGKVRPHSLSCALNDDVKILFALMCGLNCPSFLRTPVCFGWAQASSYHPPDSEEICSNTWTLACSAEKHYLDAAAEAAEGNVSLPLPTMCNDGLKQKVSKLTLTCIQTSGSSFKHSSRIHDTITSLSTSMVGTDRCTLSKRVCTHR